jgi:hypothetical protein
LKEPIDRGNDLMRDGVRAGRAFLSASTGYDPFHQDTAVGTGEGQVNHRSGFEGELLLLRTLGEASVKRFERKVGLNFHP